MPSLLLELFSEEIPARMQTVAARNLRMLLVLELKKQKLLPDETPLEKIFVTPRRLAVIVENLPVMQSDVVEEKKGPKTSAPQAAIDGFARSLGLPLPLAEGRGEGGVIIEKRMAGKDETYFAIIHHKGEQTSVILKPIIEEILASFPWPKSMRWGNGSATWVRPLHSILCLFDGKVVPIEFAGITASNITYGHRFLAPQPIPIQSANDYESALKKAFVLANEAARKADIAKQAEALAAQYGLTIKPDDRLLEEVTGLVEWPVVLMGAIDSAFMDLPPEVLISEMRAHQKYFALNSLISTPSHPLPLKGEGSGNEAGEGKLSPHFLIVSNMVTTDEGKAIVAGNERVLRARLSDGRFFYDQDRKKKLEEWAKQLAGITFHAKVGTIAEKVERIKNLALALAQHVPGADKKFVGQAASLCKADLVTGMVGEFPELQGVMGRYYTLHQKEDAQVADAIRDHYLPLGPDSPVPTEPVSICIALADKLDTLISLFAAGEKPTGSKDPFALRRSALGIIRIILENELRLPLNAFLNDELLTFFGDRLAVQLKEQGIRHDIIKAVMANGDDDLARVVARAKAVQDFLATDDGANLLIAYKRANNIVEQAEKKDGTKYIGNNVAVALINNIYENMLGDALDQMREKIKTCTIQEDYKEMMNIASTLRKPIDDFFTNILVNDENNREVRANRLAMLAWIRDVFNVIANFSLIEG